MQITFPEFCPARWTICQLTFKQHNTKRETGIVNFNIFWISAVLGHPTCYVSYIGPLCACCLSKHVTQRQSWYRSDQVVDKAINDTQSSKVEAADA